MRHDLDIFGIEAADLYDFAGLAFASASWSTDYTNDSVRHPMALLPDRDDAYINEEYDDELLVPTA